MIQAPRLSVTKTSASHPFVDSIATSLCVEFW